MRNFRLDFSDFRPKPALRQSFTISLKDRLPEAASWRNRSATSESMVNVVLITDTLNHKPMMSRHHKSCPFGQPSIKIPCS